MTCLFYLRLGHNYVVVLQSLIIKVAIFVLFRYYFFYKINVIIDFYNNISRHYYVITQDKITK